MIVDYAIKKVLVLTFVFERIKTLQTLHKHLNNDFSNVCEWSLDNKFGIHFGEDKTKTILLGTKRKLRKVGKLHITYQGIDIKQNFQVTYLRCILMRQCLVNQWLTKPERLLTVGSTIYLEKSTF